jgi:hypothetical protein
MDAVGIEVRGRLGRSCVWAILVGLAAVTASGCKTGTAGMKPSWWSFGGSGADDASALASAPAFEGDVKKPSEAAKPYPTTTTPNGYVLTDPASPAATGAAAGQQVAEVPAAVTYGSTPKPGTVAEAAGTEPRSIAAPAESVAAGSNGSVAPQVGPYAGLAAEPSAPGLSPVPQAGGQPAASAFSASSGSSFPPPPSASTTAPRDVPAWTSPPAATTAAAPASGMDGRYGTGTGSRFASLPPSNAAGLSPVAATQEPFGEAGRSSGGQSTAPPGGPLSAAPGTLSGGVSSPLPGSGPGLPPAGLDPLPASAGAAGIPSTGFATPPAAALPSSAGPAFPAATGLQPPATVPAAAPPGGVTPANPVRRRDPVYRPGGTSSYRPSREILVAGGGEESAVRPAAFETPVTSQPAVGGIGAGGTPAP